MSIPRRAGRVGPRHYLLPGLLPLLTAGVCAQRPPAIGEDFESALQRYKVCIARKPFQHHTEGRSRLARTGDAKALGILLKDYAKPQAFKLLPRDPDRTFPSPKISFPSYEDYTRYTIATLLRRHFDGWVWNDQLAALRRKHDKPADAWLWARTLGAGGTPEAVAEAVAVVKDGKKLHLRCAAVEALASRNRNEVLELVPGLCAEVQGLKNAGERRMLVGVLASAILLTKGRMQDATAAAAVRAFAGLLAPELKLSHSAKMVIARFLATAFGKDVRYVEPEPWLQLLEQNFTPPKRSGNTVTKLRFFGIEAEGDRLCYIVDLSNSMLEDIDPALLKKGPVTGKPRKRKKGQMPTEEDIPWHMIKTRFDLAREHLKISIQRLSQDKRFCVVWFGDEAGMLKSTPGMVKATAGTVRKVVAELDSIKPMEFGTGLWPKQLQKSDAPKGFLRGDTNIHAAFRLAFGMRSRGLATEFEHVDLKALAEGCDTIFLLSDGAPSVDDFMILDRDYGEAPVVRNMEEKVQVKRTPNIWYPGPYRQPNWLRWDIERLNLFRKVQIHCVGIGEADVRLLEGIAGSAMGQVYLFGRKAKESGGQPSGQPSGPRAARGKAGR